ncbi:argininosuccinate lyase [Fusobacterium sp.]|uniref:argininosuccinate lyase n=1 Tax=Fusobacterium sp. TaxID=68766 RepID=UPI00260EFEA0|nr:argininosuccinate lyase [Fusobacterium sp.]
MQYFSGRFKEKASNLILDFHSTINFEERLAYYDIMGSIAHVRGLGKQGIVSNDEATLIEKTLREILEDIENKKIKLLVEYEDIHMNVEKNLIDRIGDIGKKLHTGRSRNDQTAVDLKLYLKDEIKKIQSYLIETIEILNNIAKENKKTFMPGFTHLQKAQPICFSHYVLGYIEMFKRDYKRLENAFNMMNVCPLGSAALAGTSYPLDMEYTSELLGFERPVWNSLDGVSDRDHVMELISALSIIMVHLSRFCEEIIIYCSNDFGYLEMSDAFSTGSSIMPQKKNPDAAELIRGKSGRVFGDLMGILTTMKGIPLAYNKDMQEDKEAVFDALDTVKSCFSVFNGMIKTMKPNKKRMLEACQSGFINATDVADYLTNKGMSFRDAYKIVGSIVSDCIDKDKSLEEMNLEEYKNFSDLFEEDIYNEINIENCVEKRTTKGGPAEKSISLHIEDVEKFLKKEIEILKNYKLNDIF